MLVAVYSTMLDPTIEHVICSRITYKTSDVVHPYREGYNTPDFPSFKSHALNLKTHNAPSKKQMLTSIFCLRLNWIW